MFFVRKPAWLLVFSAFSILPLFLIVSSLGSCPERAAFFAPLAGPNYSGHFRSVRLFVDFFSTHPNYGLIFNQPCVRIWDKKSEYTLFGLETGVEILRTTYATRAQLEHVLAALMPTNRLVVRLCMATGLRVSDILELKTAQLRRRQTIRERKTGKTRRITWPAALYEQMQQQAGRIWVFEARCDPQRHRQRQTVWKDIKHAEYVFKRSGVVAIGQNLGTHTARKYAAVEAYRQGGLSKAQRVLNHSDPLITRIYALSDVEVQ